MAAASFSPAADASAYARRLRHITQRGTYAPTGAPRYATVTLDYFLRAHMPMKAPAATLFTHYAAMMLRDAADARREQALLCARREYEAVSSARSAAR